MPKRTFVHLACAAAILVFANAVAADLVIYPAKGQSAAQQSKDQTECQGWAKQNTGIDPVALANQASQPAAAPAAAPQQPVGGERARGAVRGAAGGAAIGAIAGDAGKGAAAGAVAGTMVGGSRQRAKQQQNAANQQAAQQQTQANQQAQNADVQAKLGTYNKAYSACLEGRGYTVK
ncbi:MAG TPA: glycine zipper family protein [Myxococcota bacterium]|nr:glycine zipper family protein [Myxococcota bacterium]